MNHLINFKSFFKFLSKNQLYTFVEIFGLSVSFMFVILIGLYTWQNLSTDRFQENLDRLYFLNSEESFGFAYKMADKLKDRYPEIEAVLPYMKYYQKLPVKFSGDKKANVELLFVEPSFFQMLSFQIKNGERTNPLEARNYAVISESFANKAFPGQDPLGQLLYLNDSVVLTVNAVIQNIENSTIPYGDILLRADNSKYWNEGFVSDSYDNFGAFPILILAHKGSDLSAKTDDLLEFLKKDAWVYENGMLEEIHFTPMKEAYFSPIKGYDGILINQGNRTFVLILLSVGVLILIFAIINYINLTVAQTGFRAKEMATRRLLGSSRKELFYRLISESTLLTFCSFFVGLFLLFMILPYANNLLNSNIHLKIMFTPGALLISIIIILIIGFLSGLLPAFVISNAKPVEVVKGTLRQKTKMVYSKFFITFQNVITIALVTASIVMFLQVNYLIKAPLGYNTTNIIDINVSELDDDQTSMTIGKEIERLAAVKRVGFSQGTPFDIGNNYTLLLEDKVIQFQSFIGDQNYVDMLGLQIVKDNNLGPDKGFYLSERAILELGINENADTFPLTPFSSEPQLVAGIIKDFHIQNITFEPRPLLLRIKKAEDFSPYNILAEVEGDPFVIFEQIKQIYEDITDLEFTGQFIDQQIAKSFAQQKTTAQILIIFSGIAILLSLLGLLAMSTYYIQQRSREIAVRKVFGSSSLEILRKLVFTFLNYVIIAFVIVTPIIWHLMREWLAEYSYRITLTPWIFITAGLFCMFISFITVFWHSLQAANMNPVNSIKAE